nr:hypothetical protein [Pseudomonas graminis]
MGFFHKTPKAAEHIRQFLDRHRQLIRRKQRRLPVIFHGQSCGSKGVNFSLLFRRRDAFADDRIDTQIVGQGDKSLNRITSNLHQPTAANAQLLGQCADR